MIHVSGDAACNDHAWFARMIDVSGQAACNDHS
jgi:hypothetical protein